jgi:hypothetical protein
MSERATFGDFAATVTRQLGQLQPRGTEPLAFARSAESAAIFAAGVRLEDQVRLVVELSVSVAA